MKEIEIYKKMLNSSEINFEEEGSIELKGGKKKNEFI
jgi:hypothetical protein